MLFMVTRLCFWNQIFILNLSCEENIEKEKKSGKDKKKKLSQEVMKKARMEINKGTFDVVSIGHIKTLDSFSPVK